MCDVYSPVYSNSPSPKKDATSLRRVNKPMMEKRRRARINNCLTQLKTLVLDAMKRDSAQFSKLEKADILEMTVRYLRNMQHQQVMPTVMAEPTVNHKYKEGFRECAGEVMRYLSNAQGIDSSVKSRMENHLSHMITTNVNGQAPVSAPVSQIPTQSVQPLAIQIPVTLSPVHAQSISGENLLIAAPISQPHHFTQQAVRAAHPQSPGRCGVPREQVQLLSCRPRALGVSNKANIPFQPAPGHFVKPVNKSFPEMNISPSDRDLPFPFAKPSGITTSPIVTKHEMVWRPW
ncbi:hypothetical protein ScPMuIL_009779 [Solemya velum]